MFDWKRMLIKADKSILEAIAVIDAASAQAAIVVDDTGVLVGTVTDGDVRRGILRNVSMTSPVSDVMNPRPVTAQRGESTDKILKLMKSRSLSQIPIVDAQGRVVEVKVLDQLIKGRRYSNPVVLMAGGEGKRLYPLTKDCPKPLLKIGDKPILEIILENFIAQGFHQFFLSVNYKAEMIEDYFKDGSAWGCEISYLRESSQMGTAGALSLMPDGFDEPCIVMNGDVLTKTNFESLLQFHNEEQSFATMCVREYDFQVPYGVVQIDNSEIKGIDEKPVQTFFVNGGIYVLSRDAVKLIPKETAFDMPQLFLDAVAAKKKTCAYALREYWLDIGRGDDFARAAIDYNRFFQG